MTDELARVTRLADFEAIAAARMERAAFDYVAGGADDEQTLADNEGAFRRWRLRPRVLVDVSAVDPTTTMLGQRVASPVAIAPVAFQHFAHPDAELATARAAARTGTLFCLSTMSSRSLEEVARAADDAGGGPRWFQLYVHRERARAEELVRRAADAGYSAIMLTVDFPVAGNRERDARNRLPYPQVYGSFAPPPGAGSGALGAVIGGFNDASLSWPDIGWLRGLANLPVVVKGILTAEDAEQAVAHGAAGIVVSNHGGRQLDRVPASIDVLAEVVDAAAGRVEVYLDSGVRRGTDALIAVGLGARAVFLGRPIAFALSAGGEAGVARALSLVDAEVRRDMALLGVTSLDMLDRRHLLPDTPNARRGSQ
jgi:isopentenyl diphosphate isomerase/L-lactate dehydrogenase-like FMN-dependent dehydrogenase